MAHYGPWQDNPTLWEIDPTAGYTWRFHGEVDSDTADGANTGTAMSSWWLPGSDSFARAGKVVFASTLGYMVNEMFEIRDLGQLLDTSWYVPRVAEPPPAGAIDVQFEAEDGTYAADVQVAVDVSSGPAIATDGSTQTYAIHTHYLGVVDEVTGKAQAPVGAAGDPVTTVTVAPGETLFHAAGTLIGPLDPTAHRYITFATRNTSDLFPAFGAPSEEWAFTPNLRLTFYYRSPRYRWVYAVAPPQRQFPRDDGLGNSPARQGRVNASTSIQRSARQGWCNTYR